MYSVYPTEVSVSIGNNVNNEHRKDCVHNLKPTQSYTHPSQTTAQNTSSFIYHYLMYMYFLIQSLNRSNGCIMTMAHQLSLATLSQDSSTYIDPHIRSFVYDSSQADTETEL